MCAELELLGQADGLTPTIHKNFRFALHVSLGLRGLFSHIHEYAHDDLLRHHALTGKVAQVG